MAKNKLIEHHHPIGTKEEILALKSKRMTLARCAACCVGGKGVKDEHGNNIRGCGVAASCRFDDPDFMPPGAEGETFKFKGPKVVGYYRSNDVGGKEDFMSCYTWVRTLQPQYDAQERTGETLALVSIEPPKEIVEKVAKGEMKLEDVPDHYKITEFKAKSVAGPLSNRNGDMRITQQMVTRLVPNFPRPAERFKREVYEQKIAAGRAKAQRARRQQRIERLAPSDGELVLNPEAGGLNEEFAPPPKNPAKPRPVKKSDAK